MSNLCGYQVRTYLVCSATFSQTLKPSDTANPLAVDTEKTPSMIGKRC